MGMRYTLGSVPKPEPGPLEAETALTNRRIEAVATFGGGLFTALSLVMFATKRDTAGYTMGVLGALSAAIVGAIRIYGSE